MTARKAAQAGLWSSLDIVLRQGVGFVVSIILARLLMPSDFGIVALLAFFSSLSVVFVQGGLTTALVQKQITSRDEESSAFWWNLAASALFAAVLVGAAPFIASLYGYGILELLMPLVAAQVVFSALGAVQTALLTRALRFDQLTIAGVVSSTISGALGVGAAISGAGVWALAIQMTSLAAINSIVLWIVSDWRPVWHYRFGTIGPLFRFGLPLSLSSALDVINAQGFALIIGKLHGVHDLGLFSRAAGTQIFPSTILSTIIGRVALPLFAQRADDRDALKRGVRMAIRLGMLLNVPAMAGLAILSDLVILVLFGEKWLPAAPILSILAIGGMLLPLHVINLQLLLAQGRSGLFFKVEIVKKAVGLIAMIVGSLYGIEGLAYSTVVTSVTSFLINTHYTRLSLGYGAIGQLRDVAGAFLLSALMCGVVLAVRLPPGLPPILQLGLLAGLGAAVYGLSSIVLLKFFWQDLYMLVRDLIGRQPSEDRP